MGDDELNFTEEEARCWADDPRNQAEGGAKILYPLAIIAALAIVLLLVVVWFSSARAVVPRTEMKAVPLSSERAAIVLPIETRRA